MSILKLKILLKFRIANIFSLLFSFFAVNVFFYKISFARYFDDHELDFSPRLDQSPMYTLEALTDWGKDLLSVYGITTVIVTFVFFAVSIPVIFVLFKFKAKNDHEYNKAVDANDDNGVDEFVFDPNVALPKQTKGNFLLEVLWSVIPVVLLVIIAIPTWRSIFEQARAQKAVYEGTKEALKVEVIGHQWWWEFVYTDYSVTTANELVLPENTPIEFSITSKDVIHSFYIPKFGGKIDAIPGKINKLVYHSPALSLNPSDKGDYYLGQCMELCGLSHALMRFEAVIKSSDGFLEFINSHNNPPILKTDAEKRGSELFNQCMSCHSIAGTPSADLPVEKIGPDLSNFGDRRTLGAVTRINSMTNLQNWIKDPMRLKPGSLMPKLELTDQQISDVSAYILFSTAKNNDKKKNINNK